MRQSRQLMMCSQGRLQAEEGTSGGRHVRVAPGTGVISAWLGDKNDVYLAQSGCFNSEQHVPLDDSAVNVEGELMRLIIKKLITIPSSTEFVENVLSK
jgi:hypothetical protein